MSLLPSLSMPKFFFASLGHAFWWMGRIDDVPDQQQQSIPQLANRPLQSKPGSGSSSPVPSSQSTRKTPLPDPLPIAKTKTPLPSKAHQNHTTLLQLIPLPHLPRGSIPISYQQTQPHPQTLPPQSPPPGSSSPAPSQTQPPTLNLSKISPIPARKPTIPNQNQDSRSQASAQREERRFTRGRISTSPKMAFRSSSSIRAPCSRQISWTF